MLQKDVKIEEGVFRCDLSSWDFDSIDDIYIADFLETSKYNSGNVYTANGNSAFYEDTDKKRYALVNKSLKRAVFANNLTNLRSSRIVLILEYTKK